MKIYNEDKTQELNENEIALEKVYLKKDKLVTAHHDAVEAKSAQVVYEELKAAGADVEIINGKPYRIISKTGKGKSVEAIQPIPAKEAYDEEIDIQVYVPYTEEELKERTIAKLQARRERECFTYVNRGAVWYDGITAAQRKELDVWYRAWLNVTETLTPPDKPEWLK